MSEGIEAVVTDIRLESRAGGVARWQVALSGAGFAAGDWLVAEARSGARLEVRVLEVVEEDGVAWCVVEKPLVEGTVVRVRTGTTG